MTHTPDPEPPITTEAVLRALRTTGHIDIPDPDGTGDFYRIDVDLFRINGEANDVRFINLDELEIILRARDSTRPQIVCDCGRTIYITAADPETKETPPILTELDELAASFDDSIDWSDGRSNYGDNEAYAACARQLRALIASHRKG